MRILHRVNLNVTGGVENQFRAFVTHPAVRRCLVNEALIGEPVHPDLAPDIAEATRAIHSFKRWHGLSVPGWPRSLRSRRAAGIIRSVRPDGLLSWSAFAKPELAVACRCAGVPLLYREGGGAWGEPDPEAARAFLSQVRAALCNTRASMRMLQLKWGYSGEAMICLGGLRPDLASSARELSTHCDRADVAGKRPYRVGVAARLVHEKGVCLAIHALALLRTRGFSVELWVAGHGEEAPRLQRLAESLGLQDAARFLGSVRDIAAFYRDVDVLLHPALQEPLGNSTVEAAAFGRPVVATRVDGLAETVKHGETGYSLAATELLDAYAEYGGGVSAAMSSVVYDPDADGLRPQMFVRPEAFADAVGELLVNDGLRARMGQAARERALAKFSYDRHIETMTAGILTSVGR